MRVVPVLLRHRPLIASTGLLALAGLLAAVHRPASDRAGNDTPELAPLSVADVTAFGTDFSTGALLLDLVEPEDGEGGSEAELAALLAELGLAYEPAGFYSEGEHLFRVTGDEAALTALQARLKGHPLVEVVEPELEFSHVEWVQLVDNLLFKAAALLGILLFEFEMDGLDQKVTTQATYFRLGRQLQGVSFPGEALTRNGLAIKEAMLAPHKIILGNTGDALGYFVPSDEWQTGKNNNYEETVSMGKSAGDTARDKIRPLIEAGNAAL